MREENPNNSTKPQLESHKREMGNKMESRKQIVLSLNKVKKEIACNRCSHEKAARSLAGTLHQQVK